MYNFIAHISMKKLIMCPSKDKIEIKYWKVSLKTELLNITQFPKNDVKRQRISDRDWKLKWSIDTKRAMRHKIYTFSQSFFLSQFTQAIIPIHLRSQPRRGT